MKKLLLFSLIIGISLLAYSQEREYETLFSFSDMRVSGMGGPFMQFTSVNGEFAYMMGGGGAVMLNDFFFGGYGLGLANAVYDSRLDPPDDQLVLSHGGFWTGYSFFADRAIHLSISSLIGWGMFGTMIPGSYYLDRRDNIFVFAPTAELELNLTRFFRIGIGATYNLYTLVDLEGYTWKDISAPAGFLSFKFGWF